MVHFKFNTGIMGNVNNCGCIDGFREEISTEVILDSLQKRQTDLRAQEGQRIRGFRVNSELIDEKFNDCSFVRNSDKNLSNSINHLDDEIDQLSLIDQSNLGRPSII